MAREAKPRVRTYYTRPSTMDDGSACRVFCEEGHPEADVAIVQIEGMSHHDFRFGKVEYSGGEMRWDHNLNRLLGAFQAAFDQGVTHQKLVIRDTLREVIGV